MNQEGIQNENLSNAIFSQFKIKCYFFPFKFYFIW